MPRQDGFGWLRIISRCISWVLRSWSLICASFRQTFFLNAVLVTRFRAAIIERAVDGGRLVAGRNERAIDRRAVALGRGNRGRHGRGGGCRRGGRRNIGRRLPRLARARRQQCRRKRIPIDPAIHVSPYPPQPDPEQPGFACLRIISCCSALIFFSSSAICDSFRQTFFLNAVLRDHFRAAVIDLTLDGGRLVARLHERAIDGRAIGVGPASGCGSRFGGRGGGGSGWRRGGGEVRRSSRRVGWAESSTPSAPSRWKRSPKVFKVMCETNPCASDDACLRAQDSRAPATTPARRY